MSEVKKINIPVSTVSHNQSLILEAINKELIGWNETKKFAHPMQVDLINDCVKSMVDDGLIAAIDQGKMFHGLKTVYDLVRRNQYNQEEYREMISQD